MKHRIKPLEDEEKDLENIKQTSNECDCEPCECEDCSCEHEKACECENENCECENESCHCGHDEHKTCECGCEHEHKHEHCKHDNSKEEEYLNMARVIQADFDNFRKKSYEQILLARQEGEIEAIEAFLPALDSFNEAKKMITDEKVLQGVEMIEKKILEALKMLGVEKIEAEGKPFNHNLHNAILVTHDNSLDDDVVQAEYQAGYKFKDKVIRYSQVIVNKKEEK